MNSNKGRDKRDKILDNFVNLKNFFKIFFDRNEWDYSTIEEKNFYFSYSIKNYITNKKIGSIFFNFLFKILIILSSPLLLLFLYFYAGIFLSRFIYKNNINKNNYLGIKDKLKKNQYFIIKHLPDDSFIKKVLNNPIDKQTEFIYKPFINRNKNFFSIFKNIYFYNSKKNVYLLEHLVNFEEIFVIFFKYILTLIYKLPKLCFMILLSNNSFNYLLIFDLINSLLAKRYLQIQLYKKIFQNFNKIISKESKIIYVSENQFWEKILNYYNSDIETYSIFLNKNRYWDLKYCHTFDNDNYSKKLFPKNIISQYTDDISEYKKFNFYSTFHHINFYNSVNNTNLNSAGKIKNIVIYGDYQKKNTLKLINEVQSNFAIFGDSFNIFLKTHPNQNYNLNLPPFINHKPNNNVLKNRHLALVIDSSSIGLDCILNNNIVVTILSDNSINMSPLYSFFDDNLLFLGSLKKFNPNIINKNINYKKKINSLLAKKTNLENIFLND